MMLSIQSRHDAALEKQYAWAMRELDDFFGLGWKRNKPRVFLVKDRTTIDILSGRKTGKWIVGWVTGTDVYLLDKRSYARVSGHPYSGDEYYRLLKHELAHAFTKVYAGLINEPVRPAWLWEGVALYLSGQIMTMKRPRKLCGFLRSFSHTQDPALYSESGFAVEHLVSAYGKRKLLSLLKSLSGIDSHASFSRKFKEIYGVALQYDLFQN